MALSSQNHIVVWLDPLAPHWGAFVHALDWAKRLRWSLCGVLSPWGTPNLQTSGSMLDACREACVGQHVPWAFTVQSDHVAQTAKLCAVGDGLTAAGKNLIARQLLSSSQSPVLLCPKTWHPLSRMLVLDQHRGGAFLEAVACLCRLLQIKPVVLTVGASESEVRAAQQVAEQVFAEQNILADFDFAVGYDVSMALSCATQLRHCSYLVLEDRPAPPWWRWFWGDDVTQLLALAQKFVVLVLPTSTAADLLRALAVDNEAPRVQTQPGGPAGSTRTNRLASTAPRHPAGYGRGTDGKTQ